PPPAQGITFLNQTMTGFMSYSNDFTITGNPTNDIQHNNYMNSKWSNGATVHAGCNPLDNTKPIVTFMFPDDPNDSTGVSEAACGIPPSNRRGLGNVSGLTLNAGERICVDIAFPITYDSTHLASVNALKSRIVNVQNFYNNNL